MYYTSKNINACAAIIM